MLQAANIIVTGGDAFEFLGTAAAGTVIPDDDLEIVNIPRISRRLRRLGEAVTIRR
jgi:hypothetical protein